MISVYLSATILILTVVLVHKLLRHLRSRTIKHLPGPPPGSWLAGNLPALYRPKESGDADFAWTRQYGTAVCIKGTFGRDLLFISDPKALQYILNSGYNFIKTPEETALTSLATGKGLVWADGIQHSRHKKIMTPAFSYSALRGYLSVFNYTAQKAVIKLKEHVHQTGQSSAVVDILSWLSRTTLDAIGITAFDYQFNAIDDGGTGKLSKAYANLYADAFMNRSDWVIAFESFQGLVPQWAVTLIHRAPTKQLQRLRRYLRESEEVARGLLDRQVASHKEGGKAETKDVMSILIRANLSEDPKSKLRDDEILPQLTTLSLAGHESTSSTISWALYELSHHPEFQTTVREEIKATRAHAAEKGISELSVADLESMKNLLALIKETLRFHPTLNPLNRMANRDEVIPLSTSLKTKTGETITSIPVSKGQRLILSISAYNRLKSVWGEDADQWRPQRFVEGIEKTQQTNLGVVANIATFGSGVRGCIAWRFAMIQMQAILVELLENFEFYPPPGNIQILRSATIIMTPRVEHSESRRTEMPIRVKPILS